ncbi:hypothetical protein F4818DRAFT_18679 [Hypoxylon cercidicola]|nr:hypothetical protein F4818DRAFT_18679 [Hypoxylon cercidicola]
MAVLEVPPGIAVTVRINGVDCVEYDDPEAPKRQSVGDIPVSCKYIESLDDSEFSVHLKLSGNNDRYCYKNHGLAFSLSVDGLKVASTVFDKKSRHLEGEMKGKQYFCPVTRSWRMHRFKFSTVKTVDDTTKDRVEKDQKVSEKLGLIKVEVYRCIIVGPMAVKAAKKSGTSNQSKASFELAEKSLKGKTISHGTVYSTVETIQAPKYQNVEYPGERPIAAFEFQYRSRNALQQEFIVPAIPPPSRSLDGLSESELRRLAAERLEQIHGENLVKKERVRVKREPNEVLDLTENNRPSKLIRAPPEYIDLTDE